MQRRHTEPLSQHAPHKPGSPPPKKLAEEPAPQLARRLPGRAAPAGEVRGWGTRACCPLLQRVATVPPNPIYNCNQSRKRCAPASNAASVRHHGISALSPAAAHAPPSPDCNLHVEALARQRRHPHSLHVLPNALPRPPSPPPLPSAGALSPSCVPRTLPWRRSPWCCWRRPPRPGAGVPSPDPAGDGGHCAANVPFSRGGLGQAPCQAVSWPSYSRRSMIPVMGDLLRGHPLI